MARLGLPQLTFHAADLIKDKQGYSYRKLARNSHLKGLIELKLMYENDPLLFPEDQVDLMAKSAPGAGAWLVLPATKTTIREEAFHQVAIIHPTMARKDHRSPLTAVARRENSNITHTGAMKRTTRPMIFKPKPMSH
jgi:hypothetical protein